MEPTINDIKRMIQESEQLLCLYCKKELFDLHAISGRKTEHWATKDQDFGCDHNPNNSDKEVGEHEPDLNIYLQKSEEPVSKFRCVACKQELKQLTDGYQWITSNGAIFCEVTNEIHYREKVEIQ